MPWYSRPTLTETDDGALLVHYTGPKRSDLIEVVIGWIMIGFGFGMIWIWPSIVKDPAADPWAPVFLGVFYLILAVILLWRWSRLQRARTYRIDEQGIER